jgi:hypothetical protein
MTKVNFHKIKEWLLGQPTTHNDPNKWKRAYALSLTLEKREQEGRGSERDGVLGSAWSCIKVSQVLE